MKRKIRQLFEKMSGYFLIQNTILGVDEFADLKLRFGNYSFNTILDVGANIGQTARHLRENFATANIYSLEPIKATFDTMVRNTKDINVRCFNLALGAQNETIEVTTQINNDNSVMNSLLESNNIHASEPTKTEKVKVLTLAQFCSENKIDKIDFLKIDTEGFDLEVLKGGKEMLENQSISFVMAEVSMNPTNTFHVDFVEVKSYMENLGYYIFGIYEQVHEWKTKTPILRRSNVLFVSRKMAFGS